MGEAMAAWSGFGRVSLPDDAEQRLTDALIAAWGDAGRSAARLTAREVRELDQKEDEESLFDQIIRAFIEQYGAQQVSRILETTREQIAEMVLQGQMRGLGLSEIQKGIREAIPEISRVRAATIARTETHRSSNYATMEVAKTARRPLMKRWVSVEDHRTRDFGEGDGVIDQFSHRAIHGQTVAMDQPFLVPRLFGQPEPLMYPGDPSGSPGAVINCRCAMTFHRAEQD